LFAGVDEFPCELIAENDIIGASTPFLFRAHLSATRKGRRREARRKRKKKKIGT
jgi:hypothetical protein